MAAARIAEKAAAAAVAAAETKCIIELASSPSPSPFMQFGEFFDDS